LFAFYFSNVTKYFSKTTLAKIENEIQSSEKLHLSELCVIVENSLDLMSVFKGVTSRERALELFSQYRIWDTENNSGILLYILLADHRLEIIADRGVSRLAKDKNFSKIASAIESKFREKEYEEGLISGIQSITKLLTEFYPAKKKRSKNEIPNKPVLI